MRRTLLLLSVFALLALAATGQTAPGADKEPDANPQISQFVLYAERSIKLGDHSHAEDGDVGVRSATAPKEGRVAIESWVNTGGGRNLFAPSTTIENDAEVRDVWTNALKRDPDSEMGTENKFPAPDMPPLPLAFASGSGSDVTVAHNKRHSLTPGTYGAITLAHNSTLTLVSGSTLSPA